MRPLHPSQFQGDKECLKWCFRDLVTLERAINLTERQRVAVQAGGNLGVFPARLAQTFHSVYTFEPDALLFPLLVKNAPAENIIRFQAALGCERGHLISTKRTTDTRTHAGVTHVSGRGRIPTMVLDDLGLPFCDLIYLDIEGYELFALKGAVETIGRCKPVVVAEINSAAHRYGLDGSAIHALLGGMGYRHVATSRSDEIFTHGDAP